MGLGVKSATALAFGVLGLAAGQAGAQTPLERGTYLMSSIVNCGNCHTPQNENGPIPGMELAGGLVIEEDAFTVVTPNITPDAETGIGKWSESQIVDVLKSGMLADGDFVGGAMTDVVNHGTSHLSDEDLKAIAVYLKSVKAVQNKVEKKK